MNDNNRDRCAIFCSDTENCFSENKAHVRCVADMVINRVFGIKGVMEIAQQENTCEKVSELLNHAIEDVDELIEWARGLQRNGNGKYNRPIKN